MLRTSFVVLLLLHWMIGTGQPTAQWSLTIPGTPVSCMSRPGGGTILISNQQIAAVDGNGGVLATDTLWPVTASTVTAQGNLLITGNRDTAGYSIPYVRMLTPSLRELWRQSIFPNGPYEQRVKSIKDNGGGRIFLSGSAKDTTNSTSQLLCYFAGLDSTGNIYWSFPYAVGASDDQFVQSQLDLNGNLIIGINVEQINASTGEMHFRKFDPTGTFLYENLFYPIFARDVLHDMAVGSINQTFLTGSFNLTSFMGNTLSVIALFDSTGLLSTFTPYDGYGYDSEQLVTTNGDGSIYCSVSGTDMLVNHDRHFDVLKFDESGNLHWQRRHDSLSTVYETAYCISQLATGEPVVAGATRRDSLDHYEGIIVAYDTAGGMRYEMHYPSSGNDIVFHQLNIESDTDYYAMGTITSAIGQTQTLLVHCVMMTTVRNDVDVESAQLMVYPNPCTSWIRLYGTGNAWKMTIIDALGNEVVRQQVTPGALINTTLLLPGYYTVTLQSEKGTVYRKLLKQ